MGVLDCMGSAELTS